MTEAIYEKVLRLVAEEILLESYQPNSKSNDSLFDLEACIQVLKTNFPNGSIK